MKFKKQLHYWGEPPPPPSLFIGLPLSDNPPAGRGMEVQALGSYSAKKWNISAKGKINGMHLCIYAYDCIYMIYNSCIEKHKTIIIIGMDGWAGVFLSNTLQDVPPSRSQVCLLTHPCLCTNNNVQLNMHAWIQLYQSMHAKKWRNQKEEILLSQKNALRSKRKAAQV